MREKYICSGYLSHTGNHNEFDKFTFKIINEKGEVLPESKIILQEGDFCLFQPKLSLSSSFKEENQKGGKFHNKFMCLVKDFSEEQASKLDKNEHQSQKQISQKKAYYNFQTFKLSLIITDSNKRNRLISDYT